MGICIILDGGFWMTIQRAVIWIWFFNLNNNWKKNYRENGGKTYSSHTECCFLFEWPQACFLSSLGFSYMENRTSDSCYLLRFEWNIKFWLFGWNLVLNKKCHLPSLHSFCNRLFFIMPYRWSLLTLVISTSGS